MAKKRRLSRGVAVVGGGLSKLGLFKDRNSKDFFAEAYLEMLASVDKGADPKDIEAIYIGNFTNDFFVNQAHWGPIISDLVGHVPKPVTRTEGACASSALERGPPHAFKGYLALAVGRDETGLGAGIVLPQLDADGMYQTEGVQAQHRASRNGEPHFAQS